MAAKKRAAKTSKSVRTKGSSAKRPAAKKPTAKGSSAKRPAPKASAAKRSTKKAPAAKKPAAKGSSAKRQPPKRPAKKVSPAKRSAPKRRAADPRELFAAEYAAYLRAQPAIESVEPSDEEFVLRVKRRDGLVLEVALVNLYADTREVPPEQRAEVFERFSAPLFAVAEEELAWEDARPNLRVVVRACTFFSSERGERSADPVLRPFLPFLIEAIVVDLPGRMQYVMKSHLERWNVDADAVFEAATENLAAQPTPVGPWVPDAPIWTVVSEDSLESSRLLLPGWLSLFMGRVEGRPIACIPHRDLMLVAGDADPAIVRRMAETAEAEFRAASRAISPALYTVTDDGALVPYFRDDELAVPVAYGHQLLAAWEYAEQQTRLRAAYERDDVDVFVATASVLKRDETVFSYCSWAENVVSLLPETDFIVIGGDEWAFGVTFEDCERIAGPTCWERRDDLVPPRVLTTRFPDRATLEALFAARAPFYPNARLP